MGAAFLVFLLLFEILFVARVGAACCVLHYCCHRPRQVQATTGAIPETSRGVVHLLCVQRETGHTHTHDDRMG